MKNHCLNCNQIVESKFCPYCGQDAATHRFSIKHFFMHILIQGVLQLEKGFFYTIKELFTRPGHSIREYVEGKRVKHFNYFTFIVLIITIGHAVGQISDIELINTTHYFSSDQQLVSKFSKATQANPKLFTLIRIPFLALFSLMLFRKSQQNYTEHLILNMYKVCGELLIAILFTLLAILLKGVLPLRYFFAPTAMLTLAFSIWFYHQYFSTFGYSRMGLLLRSIIISTILIIVVESVTTFTIGVQDGFNDSK